MRGARIGFLNEKTRCPFYSKEEAINESGCTGTFWFIIWKNLRECEGRSCVGGKVSGVFERVAVCSVYVESVRRGVRM
ncbi:hypothetical protein COLO4_03476 [Corchorus olitorius]|uniref:Uncharacterized protein n=1 Tax=Corchorus olitorius TaxID=93759 RepID=A0A1R3KYA7_9ROSI|nr:hypothetical protein COLO4_03476 [Corchorus olitorius]